MTQPDYSAQRLFFQTEPSHIESCVAMPGPAKRLEDEQQQLPALRKELRNLNARQHRAEKRKAALELCAPAAFDTALLIMILQDGDMELAGRYLSKYLEGWQNRQHQLQEALLAKFSEMTAAEREEAKSKGGAKWPPCHLLRAKRFVEKAVLAKWVSHQNATHRVAPRGPLVVNHLNELRAASGAKPLSAKVNSQRRWVKRWASSFRMMRGAFKLGSALPLEEARDKVGTVKHHRPETPKTEGPGLRRCAPRNRNPGLIWDPPGGI
jgi:hypothetical protein